MKVVLKLIKQSRVSENWSYKSYGSCRWMVNCSIPLAEMLHAFGLIQRHENLSLQFLGRLQRLFLHLAQLAELAEGAHRQRTCQILDPQRQLYPRFLLEFVQLLDNIAENVMLAMGGVLSLAIIQLSDVFAFVVDKIAAFARHGVLGVGDYEGWTGYLNFLSHVELLYPEFEIFLEVRFSQEKDAASDKLGKVGDIHKLPDQKLRKTMEGTVEDESVGHLILILKQQGTNSPHTSPPYIYPPIYFQLRPGEYRPNLFTFIVAERNQSLAAHLQFICLCVQLHPLGLDRHHVIVLAYQQPQNRVGLQSVGIVRVDVNYRRPAGRNEIQTEWHSLSDALRAGCFDIVHLKTGRPEIEKGMCFGSGTQEGQQYFFHLNNKFRWLSTTLPDKRSKQQPDKRGQLLIFFQENGCLSEVGDGIRSFSRILQQFGNCFEMLVLVVSEQLERQAFYTCEDCSHTLHPLQGDRPFPASYAGNGVDWQKYFIVSAFQVKEGLQDAGVGLHAHQNHLISI